MQSRSDEVKEKLTECKSVYVLCRRGNDSQVAVSLLEKQGIHAKDIIGGLSQWTKEIDPEFPDY